jgi:LysM repeat protein
MSEKNIEATPMNSEMTTPNGDGSGQTSTRWLPGLDGQAFGVVCPHLGLADDPASRCTFVSEAHRCRRASRPRSIPHDVQSMLCLSQRFESCPIFQGKLDDAPARPRRRLSVLPLVVVSMLLVLATLALLSVRLFTGDGSGAPSQAVAETTLTLNQPARTAQPSRSPALTRPLAPAAVVASPEPIPAPAGTPATSVAEPTPAPVMAPTPTPTPVPAPAPTTHVVQTGENISDIATRYGLNPAALSQLNSIPWNATIFPDDVLRLQ